MNGKVLVFSVKGSSAIPYSVSVNVLPTGIGMTCSCQAGVRSLLCKHKLGILRRGEGLTVLAGTENYDALDAVVAACGIKSAVEDLGIAERNLDLAQTRFKGIKDSLSGMLAMPRIERNAL